MDYSIFLWHSYQENQMRFPDDKELSLIHILNESAGVLQYAQT